MQIQQTKEQRTYAIKYAFHDGDKEVARARLYVLYNELHPEPYGLLEDVFVEEAYRSQGLGTQLVEAVIAGAQAEGCRKLIAQSRYGKDGVHAFYERLGFRDHGKNFRMDFITT